MVAFIIDEKQDENLRILEIGMPTRETSSRAWGPGVREYYMVHFILSGEGYFNGKHLSQGNYFVTNPYQKIHYYEDKENPWNYLWILLKGEQVKEFLDSYGLYPQNGVGYCSGIEEIAQMTNVFFTKPYFTIGAETALTWAKLIFSYNQSNIFISKVDVKQRHLLKATEFIETSYYKGISPKDVADFVGLDEKYLYSIFKAYLKISVQEYLNNLRIEKAKVLLEKSDLNISEIAYSIGIDDPLNFSRFFKHIVGVSPRKYRENLK